MLEKIFVHIPASGHKPYHWVQRELRDRVFPIQLIVLNRSVINICRKERTRISRRALELKLKGNRPMG
jgi:hypothetical protein